MTEKDRYESLRKLFWSDEELSEEELEQIKADAEKERAKQVDDFKDMLKVKILKEYYPDKYAKMIVEAKKQRFEQVLNRVEGRDNES